ncbi:MAG TPA: hypothetical protein VJT33_17940, partial [bacterium]|nr:hypothetical protein [bacterium]
LPQGPTRSGARSVLAARPVRRPPLPFTGEDLWHPLLTGLELLALGAVLRCGIWKLDQGRYRARG